MAPFPTSSLPNSSSPTSSSAATTGDISSDGSIGVGGIAVAVILGVFSLCCGCYLGCLLYFKFQDHRAETKSADDKDSILSPTRKASFEKAQKTSPHTTGTKTLYTRVGPKSPTSIAPENSISGVFSFTPASMPRRHSSPATHGSNFRPVSSLTTTYEEQATFALHSLPSPDQLTTHTRLASLRPPRLTLVEYKNVYRPKQPSPLARQHSASSITASDLLMHHPQTRGRRMSDICPGLDPDYEYPMTPAQIGDGRPLSLLGRGDTLDSPKTPRVALGVRNV